MKKKMEVASPFHLHAVVSDQIGQKDHRYVTPATNECYQSFTTANLEKTVCRSHEDFNIAFYEKKTPTTSQEKLRERNTAEETVK